MISCPGYSSDQYLTRKMQDLVTFAFLGFIGSGEEIDDNHPAIVSSSTHIFSLGP
jgi:hypothetical protein